MTAGSEDRRESSKSMRARQWMNSVATESKAVHPSGQFISHSTKRGDKRGVARDNRPPGVRILWAGNEGRHVESASAWPLSSNSSDLSPLLVLREPSVSATDGVAQTSAISFRFKTPSQVAAMRERSGAGVLPPTASCA